MPTTIIDTGYIFYTAPTPEVAIADRLAEAEFEAVDYVRVDRLRIAAAPEVDVCELHFDYGLILREDDDESLQYDPKNYVGKFIRVKIPSTVAGDDDILWYGVIEVDTKQVHGSDGIEPAGRQYFTAYGLLRLIEKRPMKSSAVDDEFSLVPDGGVVKVNTAFGFNYSGYNGPYDIHGNRSSSEINGTYVFSSRPRTNNSWDAYDAVKYLLKYHAPKKTDGVTDANTWELDDPTYALSILRWYEQVVQCELRTVKEVLDEWINRRRGVSYYAKFDPATDKVKIVVFSFVPTDVTLPSGYTLTANPDQYSLDFETALDIVDATVSDVGTSQYHRVRVYGEYMTSTFTQPLIDTGVGAGESMFTKDWTDDEVDSYCAAASLLPDDTADPDYTAADMETKQRWNALARASDKFRKVFTRYKISDTFTGLMFPWHDDIASDGYHCFPVIDEEDAAVDPLYHAVDNPDGTPIWTGGIQIMRHLPFQDGVHYGTDSIETLAFETDAFDKLPEYVPILVYGCTEGTASDPVRDSGGDYIAEKPRFEQVEKLNYSAFEGINGVRWACHVSVCDVKPGLDVRAHPQHMLGSTEFLANSPAAYDDYNDPAKMNAMDPEDLYVTVCCQYQKRVQASRTIRDAADDAPIAEMVIYVPGARCDYVVPYTTWGIISGAPVVTSGGGFIRDDRMMVADVARCAAEWYGDERKTLSLTFRQVRPLFELGWLITDIGTNYDDGPVAIKTPITAVEYQFPEGNQAPRTKIETAFADLDVL